MEDSESKTMTPENKVFSIDSLLEKILEYAFINKYGRLINFAEIRSCRLVQKSWLRSTSRIFRLSRYPLFRLKLCRRDQPSGVITDAEHLRQFVNAVTGESRSEDRVPTFSIYVLVNFWRRENYQTFVDCLISCGQSLVKLKIRFPKDGGSMTFVFPSFSLSTLKDFEFTMLTFDKSDMEGEDSTFGSNMNAIYLIQAISSASQNLGTLNLMSVLPDITGGCRQQTTFAGLEYLKLPTDLTKLEVTCNVHSRELEVLTRNNLPKLTHLELNIPCKELEEGLIRKILDHFRETLLDLDFMNTCGNCFREEVVYFRFPQMEKLKALTINGLTCGLELEDVSNLEECLPSIEKITLFEHYVSMFSKWTNNSKLDSVKDLYLDLHNDFLNLEQMESLHRTFPNIRKLSVNISEEDVRGLLYVFREMTMLEELRLYDIIWDASVLDSMIWDAALLGIPEHRLAALKANPAWWDSSELKKESFSGIKNLTELQSLELSGEGDYESTAGSRVISDVVFLFGFLKMPKLRKLQTNGWFSVSPEMIREWKAGGREFEISQNFRN